MLPATRKQSQRPVKKGNFPSSGGGPCARLHGQGWAGRQQLRVGQGRAACAACLVGQVASWRLPKGCVGPVSAAHLVILVRGEHGAGWDRASWAFPALRLRHHPTNTITQPRLMTRGTVPWVGSNACARSAAGWWPWLPTRHLSSQTFRSWNGS
jgi:hypothetical protein